VTLPGLPRSLVRRYAWERAGSMLVTAGGEAGLAEIPEVVHAERLFGELWKLRRSGPGYPQIWGGVGGFWWRSTA